jgi:hypothetical protein
MGNLPARERPRSVTFRDEDTDLTSPTFAGTATGTHPSLRSPRRR